MQPVRARPVLNAAHKPPGKHRASRLGLRRELQLDRNGVLEPAFDRLDRFLRKLAEARRGEIARDPAHAETIGAIRRDGDVEHHIVEAERFCGRTADAGLLRQLDDPGMLVGQFKLLLGDHHAARLDAADLRLGQRKVEAGHVSADRREHALHPGMGVRRATHDLQALLAGVDLKHLQLVGVRVLVRLHHFGDAKFFERRGRVVHLFDFQPDAGQRVGDLVHGGVRVEMFLQP